MKKNIVLLLFTLFCLIDLALAQNEKIEEIDLTVLLADKSVGPDLNEDDYLWKPVAIKYNRFDNRVYVVDSGQNFVYVFSEELEFIGKFGGLGQGPGEFDRPLGIAADNEGYIYIADSGNMRIVVYKSDFTFYKIIRTQIRITGMKIYLACDSENNLWVNNVYSGALFTVFDRDGNVIKKFGEIELPDLTTPLKHTGFHIQNAYFYAIDADDRLIQAHFDESNIKILDKERKLIREIDYSKLPSVKRQYKIYKERSTKYPNQVHFKNYIQSLSYDDKYIYIRFFDESKNGIYVFDKKLNQLPVRLLLKNPENRKFPYNFDCSQNNYIFGFETIGRITRYPKKEVF